MSDMTIEEQKHRFAIELEEKKWLTRQSELKFLEAGQHIRSLNGFLWQIPGMAIAITGGIWYGAVQLSSEAPKIAAFVFVGIFNLLTIVVLLRLRLLIANELGIQKNFSGTEESKPSSDTKLSLFEKGINLFRRGYAVIFCWSILLFIATILSFTAARFPPSFSKNDSAKTSEILQSINTKQSLLQRELQIQKLMLEEIDTQLRAAAVATTIATKK